MPVVTADKVVNRSMYANTTVSAVDGSGNLLRTFAPGQYIGEVYAWVNRADGIYWMFEKSYNNFFYVKHDASSLSLPSLPDILQQITAEKEKEKLAALGPVNYYIEKYAPYLIGAVVIAIAAPTVISSIHTKKVSGMKKEEKKNGVLLIGGTALAIYLLTRKKTKAGPLELSLDEGEYGTDQAPLLDLTTITDQSTIAAPGQAKYVGPFEIQYGNAIAGKKDIGRNKIC
jgi:hypothetical protein